MVERRQAETRCNRACRGHRIATRDAGVFSDCGLTVIDPGRSESPVSAPARAALRSGNPAPDGDTVVIAAGREFLGAQIAVLERFVAVAL
jgi:hypothetical protein